ncbi:Os01g0708200 [Oryza sativa Japonica Group]|uniref:Os01g0708200 protein n=1 Tax=Oryza sativa subsp. japonica TaxID=39947 RepID=C7IXG4_ORYSJ|nr:Os01g0708200 [Oryza sativa Japonica Group]|eukprot:NP_001172532.1 Os01g0708200 [Oryza sativa Japonica Group]
MSSKVTFQIVHGEGNIRFGPDGVDLSDFVMTSKGIDRPAERTFQSIYSWLLRGFRIDQEVYTMSVSVVVSRATEGYFWELMPMDSTDAWRRYVEMAFERSWPLVIFVSVQEKDINVSMQTEDVEGPINAGDVVGPSMQNEENQPREEQAMGMADEGERVGIIVDEMEREDSDNEEVDDDASSDEEGDVMATDWANEDFSGLVISEGDHVPWEYKENEVIEGARYAHKDEMKEASEAGGRTLRCSKCDLRGHTYKKCPKNAEVPSGADASPSGQASDGMAYDTPALLNRGIDRNHRSFLSAVEGAQLGTFRPRTSREWLRVDPRHVPWYALVEAAADDRDPAKRWDADRSLLAALVDRWRPETHTFHLPCGEMAPTLQDVSYLLGLPLAGAAVGPVDGVFGWKEDITARFEQVMRLPHLGPTTTLPPYSTVGPSKAWLLQFTADLLHPDADDYSVRRSLEAYLLWLFGWVMFTSTHGHAVDFRLVHYARSIADAQPQDVPQWSWGSAVLAATYRALCEACTKTDAGAIIAGCPMLLQLWAAERFAIGRPVVDSAPYGVGRSAQWPEDGPTMGTYWCRRGRHYAHVQVRRGYPDFVFEFDRLQPSDVIWEPYTEEAVAARAPLGLSSLCTRDQAYWLTILPMVFDIFVEPHCPQRVMRQFGLRQVFPGNVQPTVLPADHSLTRRGQLAGALWAPRVQQYVDDWVLATEEVINELFPHTEENYRDYLRWYLPRTRARVTFTPDAPEPHVAAVTDAYPTHRDRDYFVAASWRYIQFADAARDISADITAVQVRLNRGLHLTDVEQRVTFDRMQEKMRAVMRVFSCRSAVDVVPPAGPVQPRPRAPTVGAGPRPTAPISHGPRLPSSAPSFGSVRPTAPVSHGPRLPSSAFAGTTGASTSSAGAFATSSGAFASSSSHGASIPRPHGTLLFINTVKYLYETDGPCPAGFAAGIFGTGASSSHAGRTGPTSQFYDDDLHGADHHDVLGSSQLGGAPEAHTQEQPEVTPVQAGRVGRAVPPDRLTYSHGHIRAQGRRDRGKRPRQ